MDQEKDAASTPLLAILMDVYRNRSPHEYHLEKDKLWVAGLVLQEDGGEALEVWRYGLDGEERLHKALCPIPAEAPTPYLQFTDEAVVLLHAPEDPAEPEEDKALTLRWFPLDALEEQVWRIEPKELPGALSGVVHCWGRGPVLTIQAAFLRGENVQTTCLEFDLATRQMSASSLCFPGAPNAAKLPEDEPDMEKLTVQWDIADLTPCWFPIPSEMYVVPTHIWADDERYEVELMVFPSSDIDTGDSGRTVLFIGRHCGYLAPLTIEGYPYILSLYPPFFLPCLALDFPSPFQSATDTPLRLLQDGILEADRAFADAHLTRLCREDALYRDDTCYRWLLGHTAWEVVFELPAFFFEQPAFAFEPNRRGLRERMQRCCPAYLRRSGIWNVKNAAPFDRVYEMNIRKSRALLADMRANASQVEPLQLPIIPGVALPEM